MEPATQFMELPNGRLGGVEGRFPLVALRDDLKQMEALLMESRQDGGLFTLNCGA